MKTAVLEIFCWGSLLMLGYIFVGYPLLIWALSILGKGRRREGGAESKGVPSPIVGDKIFPRVSVVLCVHNEAARIIDRLDNLLGGGYPADKLEVVVVSDGSTDDTVTKIRGFYDPRVRLLIEPGRSGKAECLNRALAAAVGSLVVFADARQRFDRDTVVKLVERFSDERVGAVSGSLEIEKAASGTGDGMGIYWKLEKRIRNAESELGTTIGCTGAVYAIRKELFQPLPADTILDDVVIPMLILNRGYRVVFEPAAVAWDPQALEPASERIRKRRTLAGNYQLLFRYPAWFLPWRNRAWWQLVSHKYLRLAGPWLLLVLLLANALLLGQPAYQGLFVGQLTFYGLAFIGILAPRIHLKVVSIPAGFVFLNAMAVAGLLTYLSNRPEAGWNRPPERDRKTQGAGGGR